jgi:hypothetical protein
MSAAAPADRRLFARLTPVLPAIEVMWSPAIRDSTITGGTRAKSAGINTGMAERKTAT